MFSLVLVLQVERICRFMLIVKLVDGVNFEVDARKQVSNSFHLKNYDLDRYQDLDPLPLLAHHLGQQILAALTHQCSENQLQTLV